MEVVFSLKDRCGCGGQVYPTKNTWIDDFRHDSKALCLLFCWINRISVNAAAAANCCGTHTAVDHYGMSREVCEVFFSHKVLYRRFGGPGMEVEVDEYFLTRRKSHKGRQMRSGTVTTFGIYE